MDELIDPEDRDTIVLEELFHWRDMGLGLETVWPEREAYDRVIAKLWEFEKVEVTVERFQRLLSELRREFSQTYWTRLGAEAHFDEQNRLVAVRIVGAKPHLERLNGSWVAMDESFWSPDGRPVYSLEEIEQLARLPIAEQVVFVEQRLQ